MTVKLPTAPRVSEGDPQTARMMLIGHPKTGKRRSPPHGPRTTRCSSTRTAAPACSPASTTSKTSTTSPTSPRPSQIAAGLVEYGKGTAEAEALFRQQLNRLLAAPLGVWFIGHADDMQVDSKTRFIPKLDKRVRTYVQGACEVVLVRRAPRPVKRTFLHTAPTAKFEAGSAGPRCRSRWTSTRAPCTPRCSAGSRQPRRRPRPRRTSRREVAA
jgi:hypothetical protein